MAEAEVARGGGTGGFLHDRARVYLLSRTGPVNRALIAPNNTLETYIWSTFLQVGLSPTLYALMSLLIALTLGLVAVLLVVGARGAVSPRGG